MWKEVNIKEVEGNAVKMIADEWMLITAGNKEKYNMMTASWGFIGEMWSKDSVVIAVRPQRYTMDFLNRENYFTLSFYGDRRDIHAVCGKESGRDVNKTERTGLTPVFSDNSVFFEEARLVLVCKKRYCNRLSPEAFTEGDCKELYPADDRHFMIIGEIVKTYVKE